MASGGAVRISILANASQAKRALNETGGALDKLGRNSSKVAGALKAAFAGAAVVTGVKAITKSASDAQQSLGATETVFGRYAKTVERTSNRAATAYGLSANTYRENANLIGSLFKNQGVSLDKLGGKTEAAIAKASDLAATFGGTTTQAVEALSSAFKGEFDPLERYGISIKQSTVNTEAMRLANAKTASEFGKLSQAQQTAFKRQATTNLITKQSAASAGAFAKETGTLAHQQQVLGAKFENIKAKLGGLLLPLFTKLFAYISDTGLPAAEKLAKVVGPKLGAAFDRVKSAVSSMQPVFTKVVGFIKKNPATVKAFAITLGVLAAAIGVASLAVGAFNAVLALNPITLVVVAIAALVAGFVYAYTHFETFRTIADKVFNAFKAVVSAVLPIVKTVIVTYFNVYKAIITTVFKVILAVTRTVWSLFKTLVVNPLRAVASFVKGAVSGIKSSVNSAWNNVKDWTKTAWNGLKSTVSTAFQKVITFITNIPTKVLNAVGDLSTVLVDAGKDLIGGFISGIGSKFGAVKDKLGELTGKLFSWKGPPKRDKVILRPAGRLIMNGLIAGFTDGEAGVKKKLGEVTKLIEKHAGKGAKKLIKSFKDEYAALLKNGRAQDAINEKLKAAQDKLKELRQQAADYAKTIADAVTGGATVTSVLGGSQPLTGSAVETIVANMKQRAALALQYNELIQKLVKAGLNQTTIQQLLDAGVDGGLATAQAIADGGADAVKSINAAQSDLTKAANTLGGTASDAMYGAGIQAAQGLVSGLTAQAANLDKAAVKLANALVKAVKKALKIKSPSREFRDIGEYVTKGLVIGLDDTYVRKQGAVMAASLQKGFGQPALDAYASSVQSSSKTTVQVQLTAEQVSQLQRGRQILMDIDHAKSNGVTSRSI